MSYSFTRRANGQVVDAAYVNELQVAIEELGNRGGLTVLRKAGMETGDTTEWDDPAGWISGTASRAISTTTKRTGSYGLGLTITTTSGSPASGVRMPWDRLNATQDVLPDAAYYSAWFYFPAIIDSPNWWNVVQWKSLFRDGAGALSSDDAYMVVVNNRTPGANPMYFALYGKVGTDGQYDTAGSGTKASAAINIPVATWTHLEVFYRWHASAGRITAWQDGTQIWDVSPGRTEFTGARAAGGAYGGYRPRQFTVNNYAGLTSPATHTLYIDDVYISTVRRGLV